MASYRIPFVLLLLMALVACQETAAEPTATPVPTLKPTATPSPTPTATPVPTATPPPPAVVVVSPDAPPALEILAASVVAMSETESFHFELEADINAAFGGISMDIPFTFVGDYEAPDRMQGIAALSLGFFTMESQIVTIGNTTYATDPETGEWTITPSPDILLLNPLDIVGSAGSDPAGFADLTLVGVEELEGAPVYHLTGSAPTDAFEGTEGQANADLWVGVEDSLIWRIVIEGELTFEDEGALGPEGQISGTADVEVTITFADYGAPVVIAEPVVEAPVVEGD